MKVGVWRRRKKFRKPGPIKKDCSIVNWELAHLPRGHWTLRQGDQEAEQSVPFHAVSSQLASSPGDSWGQDDVSPHASHSHLVTWPVSGIVSETVTLSPQPPLPPTNVVSSVKGSLLPLTVQCTLLLCNVNNHWSGPSCLDQMRSLVSCLRQTWTWTSESCFLCIFGSNTSVQWTAAWHRQGWDWGLSSICMFSDHWGLWVLCAKDIIIIIQDFLPVIVHSILKIQTCKVGGRKGIKTIGGIQYLCSNKTQINSQIHSKYPRETSFDLIEPGFSEFLLHIFVLTMSLITHEYVTLPHPGH